MHSEVVRDECAQGDENKRGGWNRTGVENEQVGSNKPSQISRVLLFRAPVHINTNSLPTHYFTLYNLSLLLRVARIPLVSLPIRLLPSDAHPARQEVVRVDLLLDSKELWREDGVSKGRGRGDRETYPVVVVFAPERLGVVSVRLEYGS
jgi:hypothetical protein